MRFLILAALSIGVFSLTACKTGVAAYGGPPVPGKKPFVAQVEAAQENRPRAKPEPQPQSQPPSRPQPKVQVIKFEIMSEVPPDIPPEDLHIPALTAQEAHEKFKAALVRLDAFPLVNRSLPVLRKWLDERSPCALLFTHGARLTLVTVSSGAFRFAVPEAAPVRCADVDVARDAARATGEIQQVDILRQGGLSPMHYVHSMRADLKKKFLEQFQLHRHALLAIEAEGLD